MSREVKYIGLDVHKEAIVIAVINSSAQLVMESIVETKASSILHAPDFVALIERICSGALERHAPADFVLVKIDNWFGSKWLGFSGKAVGALGVWHEADAVRIPPFVPNRVISQRRFSGHPAYNEVSGGSPIHKHIPSSDALQRKAALHASQTAIAQSRGTAATQ